MENKLIAEFLGLKVDYNKSNNDYGIDGVPLTCYNYNSSWDLLMTVVEKIENLDLSNWYDEGNFMNVEVSIDTGHCNIYIQLNYDPPHNITGLSDYSLPKIELLYSQVVKFIEWYNSRK